MYMKELIKIRINKYIALLTAFAMVVCIFAWYVPPLRAEAGYYGASITPVSGTFEFTDDNQQPITAGTVISRGTVLKNSMTTASVILQQGLTATIAAGDEYTISSDISEYYAFSYSNNGDGNVYMNIYCIGTVRFENAAGGTISVTHIDSGSNVDVGTDVYIDGDVMTSSFRVTGTPSSGYIFSGVMDSNGSYTYDDAQNGYVTVTGQAGVTFTPIFEAVYSFTYKYSEGHNYGITGEMAAGTHSNPATISASQLASTTLNPPNAVDGWNFVGWSTSDSGDANVDSFTDDNIYYNNNAEVLYSVWEKIKSSECDITSMEIQYPEYDDEGNATGIPLTVDIVDTDTATEEIDISAMLPAGLDLEAIRYIPIYITISDGATAKGDKIISDSDGLGHLFDYSVLGDNPYKIEVTAEDGTTKTYNIKVQVQKNSECAITEFTLNGETGTINEANKTITFDFPMFTDVTNMTAAITGCSYGATWTTPLPTDYTTPQTIRITSEDGSNFADYTVIVNVEKPTEYTVNYYYKNTDDIVKESETKQVSDGVYTIPDPDPRSGEKFVGWYDSGSGTIYDGYTAVTQINPNALTSATVNLYSKWETAGTDCEVISFTLTDPATGVAKEATIDTENRSAHVVMPQGTDLSELTPAIVLSDGAYIEGELPTRYLSANSITVNSEDKVSSKVWTLSAETEKSSECAILSFSVNGESGVIDEENKTITVTLQFGTDITSPMTAGYNISSGATISELPTDWTVPQTVTVTAEDGVTTAEYTVTVSVEELTEYEIYYFYGDSEIIKIETHNVSEGIIILEDPEPRAGEKFMGWYDYMGGSIDVNTSVVTQIDPAELTSAAIGVFSKWEAAESGSAITSFTLGGATADIDDTTNTITVICPEGTDLSDITPVITVSEGAEYNIPVNYLTDQTITVISEDKMNTTVYTVKASLGSSSELISFSYNGTAGIISGDTVTIMLPEGTDLSAINASACTVETAEGTTYTFTGTLAAPSALVLTSSDGISTKTYTVTAEAGSSSELISFSYNGTAGTISGGTVTIILPEGTDLSAINASACTVETAEGTTYTFTGTLAAPSALVLTSSDGISTKTYTVTAKAGSSSELISFSYNGTEGTISGNTITLVLPEGTDLAAINASDCTLVVAEGTTYTFTGTLAAPSIIIVKSSDGITTNTYTLNVSAGTSSALVSFKYKDTSATISGTNVTIILPEGVDPSSVSAEDCVIEVAEGSSYTFTGTLDAPSDIVVTSSDNISKQTYTLTVIKGSSTKLVSFVIAEQFEANITITHGTGNENGSIKVIFPEGTDTSEITSSNCTVTADTNSTFEFDYDFTKSLNSIVITANTGDIKVYDLTVVTDSTVTIKNFDISIEGASAVVSEDSVEITLPEGTDPVSVTSEDCTITLSNGNTYAFEGTLAELTVIRIASAEKLSYKEYDVTIIEESGLLIKSFVIPEEFGANITITHGKGSADGSIKVIFPEGTVLSEVSCTLTVGEGSTHDFDYVFTEGTKAITVTSNTGKTKIYNMTVIVRSTAVIESFAISGVSADVIINNTANTVTVSTNSKVDTATATFYITVTEGADYTFDKENMKILVTSKDKVTTKLYTVAIKMCSCTVSVEFEDQTRNASAGGAITIVPAEETVDCHDCPIHESGGSYTGVAERKYVIKEIIKIGSRYRYKICARVEFENGEYAYDYAYYYIEA